MADLPVRAGIRRFPADGHTRAALAAVLPVHERMVRASVGEDLNTLAARFYPHDAALNQDFHQAAYVAEMGLAAYDKENQ